MIGYPKTQITMYLGCTYQRGSPDWEPGNRAVECLANHWMMQCHSWYAPDPTALQFMSSFCLWALNLSKLFLIACLCILPGASHLLFKQSYRHQEQSFKACIFLSLSLQVNVKTRCNRHYCYPIMVQAIVEWSTDLGCGVRPDGNLFDT
jgi:hypothetical protein